MKAKAILSLLLLCGIARAADVSLQWDPNPADQQVISYEVYEAGAVPVKVGTATGTTITLAGVAPGKHTYFVTAKNAWGESGPSNSVSTPDAATPPANLRVITITVSIN